MVGDCSAPVGRRADESVVTESVPSDVEIFKGAVSNGVDGVASNDGGSRALADVRSCWAQMAAASVAATKYEHAKKKKKKGSNKQRLCTSVDLLS